MHSNLRRPNVWVAFLILEMALGLCLPLRGQQPPRNPSSVIDLFNQEASSSDPISIKKYAHDLIRLVVPTEAGAMYMDSMASRLAKAEEAARSGDGGLVPEASVALAFNELMQKIGAPSSIRATEETVRTFRDHAASTKSFTALLSADRNGNKCYPGEAVFIIYQLTLENGNLSWEMLDGAKLTNQGAPERNEGNGSRVMSNDAVSDAKWLLSLYSSQHNRGAIFALWNILAAQIGY